MPFELMSPSPMVLKTLGKTLNSLLNEKKSLESSKKRVTSSELDFYLFIFLTFIFETERACGVGEGQRERERENPKQGPCCQCRA